jgi:hypothetical protein
MCCFLHDAKCEPSHMQTQELYDEHSEIIVSFRKLDKYIINRESDKTLDFIVSIQLSMLEHNEKEEKVFLPIISHLLFEDRDDLEQKLDDFVVSNKSRKWLI